METVPHVFVGGSSEAEELAVRIGAVIEEARMVPIIWNTDAFRAGRLLLEEIERFPGAVQAAILLATPDMSCSRRGRRFYAPVPNVLFEYGYLGGRLTRDRVAVCRAQNAVMPSDAAGVKLIEIGRVENCSSTSRSSTGASHAPRSPHVRARTEAVLGRRRGVHPQG